MDFFKGFVVSTPKWNQLAVGDHIVRMIRCEETNSFQQFSGEPKVELPPWKDATPQLAVTVVAAEEGKSGGMTHRFNGRGYIGWDELTEKQRKSGDYEEHGGYACSLNVDGLLVREESTKNTEACENILNQFAAAIGIKEGDKLGEGIEKAIKDETKFRVTVTNEPYLGRDQFRLSRFRKYEPVTADLEE